MLRARDQMHASLRDLDTRDGPAVEVQVVLLDAIAENDSVLGHLRRQFQRAAFRNDAADALCRRAATDKRLSNGEVEQVRIAPERIVLTDGGHYLFDLPVTQSLYQ